MADKKAKLTGVLGLNTSLFEAGLKKAGGAAASFAGRIGNTLKSVVTGPLAILAAAMAGAFAVKNFIGAVEGAISVGAAMQTLSEQTGVSVGALKTLGYAFKEGGVSTDLLSGSVGHMQRTLYDAAKGGGAAQAAIGLLHFKISQLKGLSPEEQFRAIGTAIDAIQDPTEKAGAAMAVFGKEGKDLMPVFANLKNLDFENLSKNAKVLQANAVAFRQITIGFDRAFGSIKGIYLGFAAGLVPALQDVLKLLPKLDFVGWGQKAGEAISKVYFVVKNFIAQSHALATAFGAPFVATFKDVGWSIGFIFKGVAAEIWKTFGLGFKLMAYGAITAFQMVKGAVQTVLSKAFWVGIWGGMTTAFHSIADPIAKFFSSIVGGVSGAFSGLISGVSGISSGGGVTGKVLGPAAAQIAVAMTYIKAKVGEGIDWVKKKASQFGNFTWLKSLFSDVLGGIISGLSDFFEVPKAWALGFLQSISQQLFKFSSSIGLVVRSSAIFEIAVRNYQESTVLFGQAVALFASLFIGKPKEEDNTKDKKPTFQGSLTTGNLNDPNHPDGLSTSGLSGKWQTIGVGQAYGQTNLIKHRDVLNFGNTGVASGDEQRPNNLIRRGDHQRAREFEKARQKESLSSQTGVAETNKLLGRMKQTMDDAWGKGSEN